MRVRALSFVRSAPGGLGLSASGRHVPRTRTTTSHVDEHGYQDVDGDSGAALCLAFCRVNVSFDSPCACAERHEVTLDERLVFDHEAQLSFGAVVDSPWLARRRWTAAAASGTEGARRLSIVPSVRQAARVASPWASLFSWNAAPLSLTRALSATARLKRERPSPPPSPTTTTPTAERVSPSLDRSQKLPSLPLRTSQQG